MFFTSDVELTNDAQTGPEDNAPNLYEYDVETKQLTDLSVDELTAKGKGDPEGADVLGLVTASEDGSYVYFVAEGKLAEGATSGQPNMYLHHAGRTSFIATLAPATNKETTRGKKGGDSADWAGEQPEPAPGFTGQRLWSGEPHGSRHGGRDDAGVRVAAEPHGL